MNVLPWLERITRNFRRLTVARGKKPTNVSKVNVFSSGSRNLSEWGPDDSRNLRPRTAAIFLLTSFNRGRNPGLRAPGCATGLFF